MISRTRYFANLLAVLVFLLPTASSALDYGITPNEVFGLWKNVNDAVVYVSRHIKNDDKLTSKIMKFTPREFKGKKPADVHAKVMSFAIKLNRLRKKRALEKSHRIIYTLEPPG